MDVATQHGVHVIALCVMRHSSFEFADETHCVLHSSLGIRAERPVTQTETPPDKIETLIGELRGYISKIDEVHNFNVVFSDIRMQAYVVVVEIFTLPIENSRFTAIKQALNLFVLQTLEKHDIRLAAQGQELAFVS